MPNPYFNHFSNTNEQSLYEDLIVETLTMYAHTMYYLPRTLEAKDEIYGEDPLSTYNLAIPVDFYVKSFSNYEGDGTFLSKFNLEIRDQLSLTLARRTFTQTVTTTYPTLNRPKEGDLLYSPMMKRMFVTKFVDNTEVFYQLGKLYTWGISADVWEYSNERFNTGVAEIDSLPTVYSNANVYSNTAYETVMNDVFETNLEFNDFTNDTNLIDWSSTDPFSERT